ncbi:L7Ae/L30e/S12e/Gadd45 family ribosomal protein [Texcoconibacillus texcoconensis]|uniref:Ribosomal protein L7Ae-like RNA K-turn-binding protein n=1 Tax=Texcoconibacillus texcoconensis TaxID=1095777 RepID=A0A840QIU6_9BACI|nr:ribosomal L7Ae/L30e/S12e/Gadd45 family protein [Texcoconibacillus texcoconensis]MBB5172035.1 ribosomal protein L7Ae-like RNA K-turn-binding protein [Texcoconibacillus texcoconensis]
MSAPWLNLLGLAFRAGKVVSGEELVRAALSKGNVHCIVLAGDASEATKTKMKQKGYSYNVPVFITDDRQTLGHAIGKHERVVIGIQDVGFAKKLEAMFDRNS